MLTALHATAVPVPRTYALCADPDVIGAPFYLMAEARGDILRAARDSAAMTPAARGRLAEAFVRTLADLHAVDAVEVGLGDYGRPSGFIARQLRRWGEQWTRSRTRDLPDMDTLLSRLADAQPPEEPLAQGSAPTVVHGDYRLDNTVVDRSGRPRAAAAGGGRPGLGAVHAGRPAGRPRDDDDLLAGPRASTAGALAARGPTAQPGFPTRAELAERYAALTGRDLSRLPFYLAFSAMKLAVILEGVHARYLNGQTVSAGYEQAGRPSPPWWRGDWPSSAPARLGSGRRVATARDVDHPRDAEPVDAHAERVAPHLGLQGHGHRAARGQLVPVAAELGVVVAAQADRDVVAVRQLQARGGVRAHQGEARRRLQLAVHDLVCVGGVGRAEGPEGVEVERAPEHLLIELQRRPRVTGEAEVGVEPRSHEILLGGEVRAL